MIDIKCLRSTLAKPRVAQPHRWEPRMGMFAKLLGKESAPPPKPVERAVIVEFDYIGSTDLAPSLASRINWRLRSTRRRSVSLTATKLLQTAAMVRSICTVQTLTVFLK